MVFFDAFLEPGWNHMDRAHSDAHRARPLVLIVTDGPDDTLPLSAIALAATGFDVASATSSEQACARASELRPNVVVTEWPVGNGVGWDLLDYLQQDPRLREVRVVVLCDSVQQQAREGAGRRDSVVFRRRPCPPEALAMDLRRLLDARS